MFVGSWEKGQFLKGSWEMKGFAVYDGEFKHGRPIGAGKFSFTSGITQTGVYVEAKKPEGEEEPASEGGPVAPNVAWQGDSIVVF